MAAIMRFFRRIFGKNERTAKQTIRIAVIGAPQTGKTAFIERFVMNKFCEGYTPTSNDLYESNVSHEKDLDTEEGKVTFKILDVAGSYSFTAMDQLAIDESDAFILVFDKNDEITFRVAATVRSNILQAKNDKSVIVFVASKDDVTPKKRTCFQFTTATIWNHGYVETSAKDDKNIARVFEEVMRQYIHADEENMDI